ncbi:MAG: alpha amylase C-terminal domain-containing protein, partial [Sediminibacterium sp.]
PMIYKMPGDEWQKFANLRLLYAYMFLHPGAKLLFMGNEFAATSEWNFKTELPWDLLQFPSHNGIKLCVQHLNILYKTHPALYELQFDPAGFEWVETNKRNEGVLAFMRKSMVAEEAVLVVLNMTPVSRNDFPIHVYGKKVWKQIFNSDAPEFWGVGDLKNDSLSVISNTENKDWGILTIQLPALSALVFK